MTEETPKPTGRPSKYTAAVRDEICERLATGESLRRICLDEHLPERRTIHRWIIENIGEEKIGGEVVVEGFCHHYTRARDIGLDEMADEILDISDDGSNDWMDKELDNGRIITVVDHEHIARSRLRTENRKWYLSKMAPKRYGNERVVKHQQLDGDGEAVDPAGTQINIHAKEIADAVHAQMEKILKAENDATEA